MTISNDVAIPKIRAENLAFFNFGTYFKIMKHKKKPSLATYLSISCGSFTRNLPFTDRIQLRIMKHKKKRGKKEKTLGKKMQDLPIDTECL